MYFHSYKSGDFDMPPPAHRNSDDWNAFYDWYLDLAKSVFGNAKRRTDSSCEIDYLSMTIVLFYSEVQVEEMTRLATVKVYLPDSASLIYVNEALDIEDGNIVFDEVSKESGSTVIIGSYDAFNKGYVGEYRAGEKALQGIRWAISEVDSLIHGV